MARLRNRIVKADYWGDGDLLRMPRDKRDTYRGLWAVAEDSGCLEDDPFTWKLLLWPGPFDADITVELLEQWRDELIATGKLVPYHVDGRRYFFIEPFHRHEHPRNPQKNDLPLPPWVVWVPSEKDPRKGLYKVEWEILAAHLSAQTDIEQPLNNGRTSLVQGLTPARPALPCPDRPRTAQNGTDTYGAPENGATPVDNSKAEDAFADVDFGEEEPSNEEPKQEVQIDTRTPGQQLVGFYVDERTQAGSKPTDRQRGIVADVIGQKIRGGSKPENVREAIKRMIAKGKAPSMLPAFVDEVEAERKVARPRSTVPEFHEPTPEERGASLEAARKAREQVAAMAAGIGRAMP